MSKISFKKAEKNLQKYINNYKKSFSKLSKSRYLVLGSLVLVLAGMAYLSRSLFFVAFVNGVPITRREFTEEMEKSAGSQVLDSLVTQKLIYQEAQNKNIEVTDQDVEDELNRITSMLEAQGSSLDAVLGSQNQSIETLKENIRLQKIVEELLSDKIQVSDQDVSDYFDQNKDYFGEDAKLDDVKDDIKEQLVSQKLNEEFTPFLSDLKGQSKIIYLSDFDQDSLQN